MFILEISSMFLRIAVSVLFISLIFFVPFFRDLLFSKKELIIRRRLEDDSIKIEMIGKIIKDYCKLQEKNRDYLFSSMIKYCTKIFESYDGREKFEFWINEINSLSLAGSKRKESLRDVFIIITRRAILNIPLEKLAHSYFRYIFRITKIGSKDIEESGLFEKFCLDTFCLDKNISLYNNFVILLKEELKKALEDNKDICKSQAVLLDAEIIKVERMFSLI